ncbi:hypothetical protein A3A46_02720 [Candidatus Roizmanbacteria bacterium RIFCSPLOWO2_01_FULL_37_13]|uniref:Uncharacterized protein n=1 Tax=Candidatus Roizmanbacteria bacterium RIFCSPHIGHO2_02_FULL_38_11 TaxID=1802039 RepID=A0A1F7H0E0_9BACT|nr:MAG: hypothetical protein A3C25_01380 [Candidatus Roizmanbacteria bacterium RIFCSPHIGHO2_02_FULL_38_11]OGK34081.1 MAG: hypothetical protein A3F58_01290 [Candidatus Roizmanbacteria bacterium RIFCSPHIGHO2_12_FULL_37_9b]OGK43038.1 MAG: hypothetical protein A3A46_02720 [Candidatus Roizmanbacteria bacterium RIFCSPLOWO2_01_FULL_37_13]
MQEASSEGLALSKAKQITSALRNNQYITFVGAPANTAGPLDFLKRMAQRRGKKVIELDIGPDGLQTTEEAFSLIANGLKELSIEFSRTTGSLALIDLSRNLNRLKDSDYLFVLNNIHNLMTNPAVGENILLYIRSLYHERATGKFKNIQFALVGEKHPTDIKPENSRLTEFNIGVRFDF